MRLRAVTLLIVLLSGCGIRPVPPKPIQKTVITVQTPVPEPIASPHVESPSPTPEKAISRATTAPSRSRPSPTPTPDVQDAPTLPVRASEANLPSELPAEAKLVAISDTQLSDLHYQVKNYETAAGWRKVAERALEVQDFGLAHDAYSKEAEIYKEKGHTQAYLAEQAKAAQYSTEIGIYQSVAAKSVQKLERMEPANGCYIGAFIDRDSTLKKHHLPPKFTETFPNSTNS